MLGLPVYKRGGVYYLHTRKEGRQVKISLRTAYKREAIARAVQIRGSGGMVKKLEIDLFNGVFKADPDKPGDIEALERFLNNPKFPDLIASMQTRGASKTAATPSEIVTEGVTQAPTLSETLERLIAFRGLKEGSAKSYRERLKIFINNSPGDLRLDQMTRQHILNFQDKMNMRREIGPNTQAGKNYSPASIDAIVSVLRSILNFGAERGFLDFNPVQRVKNIQTTRNKKENSYKPYTVGELQAIYARIPRKTLKDKRFFIATLLATVTGARLGEVCGLEKNAFKVDAAGGHYFEIRDSKSAAGVRLVPFPARVWDLGLAEVHERASGATLFDFGKVEAKGYGNAVSNKFRRTRIEAGITRSGLTFHSLRKFFNDFLFSEGISEEVRAQLLGHEHTGENAKTYTSYPLEKLAELVGPAQLKALLQLELR